MCQGRVTPGRDTAIDASTIDADAGCERKFNGAADATAWDERERQARPVQEYLAALDAALPAAPDEREPAPPKYTSPTDPQAAWSIKHGPGRFSYATNYLIDSETSVILDVEATPARLGAEVAATRTLIMRAADRFGFHPERLAADKAYGSAGLLRWLFERGIEPHVPLDRTALTQGKLPRSAFTYDETADAYICPEGHQLRHRGYERRTRTHRYSGSPNTCGACPRKPECTDAPTRRVLRMADEAVRDRVSRRHARFCPLPSPPKARRASLRPAQTQHGAATAQTARATRCNRGVHDGRRRPEPDPAHQEASARLNGRAACALGHPRTGCRL